MGTDKEPNVPVILIDEKKWKRFPKYKTQGHCNLDIIFWYYSWSKIQVLIGYVVNRCWERVQKYT